MVSPPLAWRSAGDATTRGAPPAAALGVVLAGGVSRRMGRDKAALAVGGETLAAHAARRLLAVCGRVVIADGGRGLLPLPEFPSVVDGPGQGPAAGILGAAGAYPSQSLLVLACDLPAIPAALLEELAAADGAADWAVPRWQRGLEPLCALYRPAALAELAAGVARGVAAPRRLAEAAGLKVRYLEGERLRRFGAPEDLFFNLNTPLDVEQWLATSG